MKVNYHIDKLVLVYQIPEDFMAHVNRFISTPDFLMTSITNVFIYLHS